MLEALEVIPPVEGNSIHLAAQRPETQQQGHVIDRLVVEGVQQALA